MTLRCVTEAETVSDGETVSRVGAWLRDAVEVTDGGELERDTEGVIVGDPPMVQMVAVGEVRRSNVTRVIDGVGVLDLGIVPDWWDTVGEGLVPVTGQVGAVIVSVLEPPLPDADASLLTDTVVIWLRVAVGLESVRSTDSEPMDAVGVVDIVSFV